MHPLVRRKLKKMDYTHMLMKRLEDVCFIPQCTTEPQRLRTYLILYRSN